MQANGETVSPGGSSPADSVAAFAEHDSPERMCIVTRERQAPENLIRFVAGPDGSVVPDIRAKLPGRGVWVTARTDVVTEAVRRQAFSRGLKVSAKAPATLPADVDALLERDCLQSLSFANKAGAVVAGFTKIEAEINGGNVLPGPARDGCGAGRNSQARASASAEIRRGVPAADQSFRLKPNGFGIGAHKCDTRSA